MTAAIVSLSRYRSRKERSAKGLPDPVIGYWKCRVWTCMSKVGITQTAIDVLEILNSELARRREKPLTEDDVMLCETCAPLELERKSRKW